MWRASLLVQCPLLLWSMSSRCTGFSSCGTGARQLFPGPRVQPQQLWHTGVSCSMSCEIFLDQGLKSRPLHWQADSHSLYHQGSPICVLFDDSHFGRCQRTSWFLFAFPFFFFFITAILVDVEWCLIVILICIYLTNTNGGEHPYISELSQHHLLKDYSFPC